MSDPVWPGTLPALVTQAGFSESVPDQAIETPTDAGPGKVRRRQTGTQRPIKAAIRCTAAQVAAFDTFWLSTLAAGTLQFTWVNPRTQAAATLRFRKPVPAYTPLGGGNYQVEMHLWVF